MRVLIVGCGYIGLPLGLELARRGHEVFGIRRDPTSEHELTAAGIHPVIADITRPKDLAILPTGFDWVVSCVSASSTAANLKSETSNLKSPSPSAPRPLGAPKRSVGGSLHSYRSVYLDGTGNLLDWLSKSLPAKFIYISSTSVYGQTDGSPVDEASPAEPAAPTAKILVNTEDLLLAAFRENHFPATILRLAGIYGPGRGYWFKQFLSGHAVIEGQGNRILNMIHRDDVVGAILAVLNSPVAQPAGSASPIYNVVDNEPITQFEFFQWLSAKLGRPLPPVTQSDDPPARKRGLTSKRVSNRKLRQELHYDLKFPTFREGYSSELAKLTC
jgi:nucleoside-diphosphate-sugar epimerase